jgi:uncharacterized membrane protein (UPF0182 family)
VYWLIFFSLLALGGWLLRSGVVAGAWHRLVTGAVIIATTIGGFALLGLWGELLWFEALGYARRFWIFIGFQAGVSLVAALCAGAITGLLSLATGWPRLVRVSALASTIGGALWGLSYWQHALLYLNRVNTGVTDPVFGQDTGFWLFALPFYQKLYALALFAAVVALGANLIATFEQSGGGGIQLRRARQRGGQPFLALLTAAAAVALVLAAGRLLAAYGLLYSEWGVVAGAGWTDIHVRLPAYLAVAATLVLFGVLPLVSPVHRWIGAHIHLRRDSLPPTLLTLGGAWMLIGGVWLAGLGLLPALVQWLVVEPNEITFEKPYIARNIEFTRRGFRLDKVEERQFPAAEAFTREMASNNRHLLSEVRLWDWRALAAVYKQFQEIRLYYEFVDVDMDRYHFGDRYRQVMASARELAQGNLPRQSQTFVNKRFKYTHGYGLTLATVSDFTEEGLPNLLVRDIPPKSSHPDLAVTRPQIYYGELTRGPVVVNTEEPEFDYPSGEKNAYIRYPGGGGVRMDGLWRKFIYGWKFDGTRFFLSGYPRQGSRVMFHRQIRDRVKEIAPFLELDEDPYIVLVEGRLYWIIDAYTRSDDYPYSEPFSSRELVEFRNGGGSGGFATRVAAHLDGANYVRNSVKAVVDAFEGSVDLYVFEPDDALVRAWQSALPGVFKDREDMPPGLRAHVRYPQDFLLTQGLVYTKYHMGDPAVFYNQEDLWVRATEKHYDRVQPVEPYYVMWELPDSDQAEFVLIQPFTPKNRQVLIGWIAGMSDGDNYGRFLAYKFPKEKRVLGPQQVETKIDQDSFLSGQLTLWDQRGSNVIRGNVLAIPLDNTLLYVEPIYLRAETAAYPELRLVVVMHGDSMSYAESFDAALDGLFEEETPRPARAEAQPGLASQANQAFLEYLDALGGQRFDEAAARLKTLRDLLGRLAGKTGEAEQKAAEPRL